MNGEKLLALLLAPLLAPHFAAPRARDGATERAVEAIQANDQLLTQLLELRRRVRGGELPSDAELATGRTTREEILAGLDVRRAAQLGMEPKTVRDRLQPGFFAELDLLSTQRSQADIGPLREASPLLTMVLDLEQDLWREADRRRQLAGIKSPLDSGPLVQRLDAEPAPQNGAGDGSANGSAVRATDGNRDGEPRRVASAAPPKGSDARLVGQAHYRAGRFADALAAWKDIPVPGGNGGLEFIYQRADCLMRTGEVDEAIAAWEKLAAENKESRWAAQAQFALKVAGALKALRTAQPAATGGKS